MKSATAKKNARSKAAAPKPRSRAAKTVAAAMKGSAAAVDVAFDETQTVVAETLLPIETPHEVADAAHDLSDEAYVEQLLAGAHYLNSASNEVSEAQPVAVETIAAATSAVEVPELVAEVEEVVLCEQPAIEVEATTPSVDEAADVAKEVTAEATVVVLPSQCLLRDSVLLKESLLPHVGDAAAFSIDTHAVERIDTAAMQVLLAFVRDRHSQQRVVNWLGLNEAFVDSAQLLGIGKMLGLPASAAVA